MKKKIIISGISFVIVLVLIISTIYISKEKEQQKLKMEKETLLQEINSHYNKYVKTTKDAKLYKKENDTYVESGIVSKDVKLTLIEEDITIDTKYFLIKDLDMYIEYQDITPIDEYKIDYTYQNYIYFNT